MRWMERRVSYAGCSIYHCNVCVHVCVCSSPSSVLLAIYINTTHVLRTLLSLQLYRSTRW